MYWKEKVKVNNKCPWENILVTAVFCRKCKCFSKRKKKYEAWNSTQGKKIDEAKSISILYCVSPKSLFCDIFLLGGRETLCKPHLIIV